MQNSLVFVCSLSASLWAGIAFAQQPLSAIDWLDKPNSAPLAQPDTITIKEPPVTDTANIPGVQVTTLGEVQPDSVGLLPSATTGLPRNMWQASPSADLIAALNEVEPDTLPAMQALIYTLLLAEADAPPGTGSDAAFLKARVQTLVRFGAVDPARALIERAGPDRPELFDLWLSLSLLTGDEDKPCSVLRGAPSLSADYAARIFCTARAGDWDTAALTFETAVAIGAIDGRISDLLAQYLDPELIDTNPTLAPPQTPTPLVFRLYEAVGSPLPTRALPRAFANADLRGLNGWKAELEAAERLAQVGALPATRLLGLYTDRSPAASGGIWDRVSAVQDFDSALFSRDPARIAATLPPAWTAARTSGLAVPFAQLFAKPLMDIILPTTAARTAFDVALLSPDYEAAAQGFDTLTGPDVATLRAVARGQSAPEEPRSPFAQQILNGLSGARPTDRYAALLDSGKLGEAILMAATELGQAGPGSARDISDALTTLRAVGLEDTARRAALQLLILGAPE